MSKPRDHDAYIEAAPEQFRPMLQQLREHIALALPDAEEVMMYDMPGVAIDDTVVAGYAAFSKQCGLYVDAGAIEANAEGIAALGLKATKTGVTFSVRKPITEALTRKLVLSARERKGL